MRDAIKESLTQPFRIFCQLNLSCEVFPCLQLGRQIADGQSDDEVSRESQGIFQLGNVQGKQWWDKQEIPGDCAERCDQQNGPAAQNHPCQQHPEQVDERYRAVAGEGFK